MRAKTAASVAAVALVAAAITGSGPPAGAVVPVVPDYTAQIAATLNGQGTKQVSMRFFPSSLEVMTGDVIKFTAAGSHSTALLPVGQDASTWLSTYYAGTDGPWSFFVGDPDEGVGAFKINNRVASPPIECGSGESPCKFDGTGDGEDGVLHSPVGGANNLEFFVQVDVPTGSTFWVVDLVNPKLRLKVDVVSSDPSTQSEIDAQKATLISQDAQKATNLVNQYKAKKAAIKKPIRNKKKKIIGYKTIGWKAWAGLDSGTVALRYMFPSKLTLKKGQFVTWAFAQDVHQGYTVTFPLTTVGGVASITPERVCDLDGDEGAEPDAFPDLADAPYCSDFRTVELDLSKRFTASVGDGKWEAGKDVASSGLRGGPIGTNKKPYKLTFPTVSNNSGFTYSSITHPWMTGKVVVKS